MENYKQILTGSDLCNDIAESIARAGDETIEKIWRILHDDKSLKYIGTNQWECEL